MSNAYQFVSENTNEARIKWQVLGFHFCAWKANRLLSKIPQSDGNLTNMYFLHQKKIVFLFITIILICCQQKDYFTFELAAYQSSDQTVKFSRELNNDFRNKFSISDQTVTELVSQILDSLDNWQERIILTSGGYQDGYNKNRSFIVHGSTITPEKVRSVQMGVTKDFLNQLKSLMNKKGFRFEPLILDGYEDPYWQHDPKGKQMDFIELYFQNRNTYQVLTFMNDIKYRVVEIERIYIQSLAEPCYAEKSR